MNRNVYYHLRHALPERVAQAGRQAALMRTTGIIDDIHTQLRETGYRRY